MNSWEDARDLALTLAGTELSTSYGRPAVKPNSKAFLYSGRETIVTRAWWDRLKKAQRPAFGERP